jgi:hypothetical protein
MEDGSTNRWEYHGEKDGNRSELTLYFLENDSESRDRTATVQKRLLREQSRAAPVHFRSPGLHAHYTGRVAPLLGNDRIQIDPPGAGDIVAEVAICQSPNSGTLPGARDPERITKFHALPSGCGAGGVQEIRFVQRGYGTRASPVHLCRSGSIIDHASRIAQGIRGEGLEIDPPGVGDWVVEDRFDEIPLLGTGAVPCNLHCRFLGQVRHAGPFLDAVSQGIRHSGWGPAGIALRAAESRDPSALTEGLADRGTGEI